MKQMSIVMLTVAVALCITALTLFATAGFDEDESPIFGVKIPRGYRQWELIAPSHEAGKLDESRGILGNAVAVKAYQNGTLPFPDGAILAKLAWKHVPLIGVDGAFVTGPATTVQIMVKDSKKYAATGGWARTRRLPYATMRGRPVESMLSTSSAGRGGLNR